MLLLLLICSSSVIMYHGGPWLVIGWLPLVAAKRISLAYAGGVATSRMARWEAVQTTVTYNRESISTPNNRQLRYNHQFCHPLEIR